MTFTKAGNFRAPYHTIRFFSSYGRVREAVSRDEIRLRGLRAKLQFSDSLRARDFNNAEELRVDYSRLSAKEKAARLETSSEVEGQQRVDSLDVRGLERFVSQISVESVNGTQKIEVLLKFPLQVAVEVMDSNLIPTQSVILAEWGWKMESGDISSGSRLFFVTGFPAVTNSDDSAEVKLTGTDLLSGPMNSFETMSTRTFKRSRYPSDSVILEAICKSLKLQAEFDDSTVGNPIFTPKVDPDYIGRGSDMSTIRAICRDNRLYFDVDGSTVRFFDTQQVKSRADVCTFVHFGDITNEREIPVTNFNPEIVSSYFVPAKARKLRALQSNPLSTIDSMEEFFEANTDEVAVTMTQDVIDFSSLSGEETKLPIGTASQSVKYGPFMEEKDEQSTNSAPSSSNYFVPIGIVNAKERSRSRYEQARNQANQKLSLTTPGHPQIRPSDNALVRSIYKCYSGRYQILTKRETLSPDSYMMELVLQRNSVAVKTRESSPSINTAQASSFLGIQPKDVTE